MIAEIEKQLIYTALRDMLAVYSPPYMVREGKNVSDKDSYGLWSEGDFEIFGRKRQEVYFAGIIMQKAYVGFYFMPIYSDPEVMRNVVSPRLRKCLKGKSCFYITRGDQEVMAEIKHVLAEGHKLYQQRGWVA